MDTRTSTLIDIFANLGDRRRVEELADHFYASSMVFQDPIQRVEGLADFKQALASMAMKLHDVQVRFIGETESAGQLVVRWEMDFRVPFIPIEATLPGVSWLEFDDHGRCIRHTDYWDMMGMFDQLVPPLRPLHRLIRRLAA